MVAVVVAFRCVRQAIIETVEFQAFRYQAQTLINHCEAIDRKYTVRIKSRELLDTNFMIERRAADGAIAKIPFQPWDSGTSDLCITFSLLHHFLYTSLVGYQDTLSSICKHRTRLMLLRQVQAQAEYQSCSRPEKTRDSGIETETET